MSLDDNDDWPTIPQRELAEIVRCECGAWNQEMPEAHALTWRFERIDSRELTDLLGGIEGWRAWWADECVNCQWGADYMVNLESVWTTKPIALGPIMLARWTDGSIDIGDGWHRAAVSVLHAMQSIPVVSTTVPGPRPRKYGSVP